ncbi:nitroimidazol reductase NimA-like FMN-containing flavoprotein (pyridoxamine 5'-phosphate oxidase superfamily) [Nocardiopsis terrae]|uniref:Nitroimidazol reductase NimA-like FMN-containing flavoprotein (Pyridoxamine 5'-phosphate oxidase superfamily) n=1 Tax=Nocardiopsis terrae TaxID=372655 RepID=A0ABR9HAS7_9ACTN|nr:pyridoxamine 5'-phosphate oxidase family protein [Nocardiopsis terrae]MBE1456144.1 nitroimidazol reductase NimA-like FMN-containing flavoprotein (pyridoxamine 5'-phosphate oxidase superfamily) [Nocardiopsis terrae]
MLSTTERTRLKRAKHKARTDRGELYDLLDEGLVCHLGVVVDGSPRVLPTGYGRIGDTLYLHGSTGARSLRPEGEVCVTVSLVDGIVLARSGMHHSVNHRCAMVFGTPRLVTDEEERTAGLRAITEQLAPGQWDVVRRPDAKEMAATRVLALSLEEASVKVRTGPPNDDPQDHATPIWAGVQPVRTVFDPPVTDPGLAHDLPAPEHVLARVTGR